MRISYHSKNSQKDIDELEYWVFSNMIVFLTQIIEEENKRNGAGQEGADPASEHKKMMSQSKKFTPNKMKKFKK